MSHCQIIKETLSQSYQIGKEGHEQVAHCGSLGFATKIVSGIGYTQTTT